MSRPKLATLAVAALIAACTPPPERPAIATAKFGVFFGGQIQERREIPFELDGAKQTQGFRVEFGTKLPAATDVEWRIDRPTPPPRKTARRTAAAAEPPKGPIVGKERVRAGEDRFEQALRFEPGDPLGLWNVRVITQGRVVLDRAFELFDPAARERGAVADGGT
jgi:hypothetical protein